MTDQPEIRVNLRCRFLAHVSWTLHMTWRESHCQLLINQPIFSEYTVGVCKPDVIANARATV